MAPTDQLKLGWAQLSWSVGASYGKNMASCKIGLITKHSFVFCSYSLGTFETKVIPNLFSTAKKFQNFCFVHGQTKIMYNTQCAIKVLNTESSLLTSHFQYITELSKSLFYKWEKSEQTDRQTDRQMRPTFLLSSPWSSIKIQKVL